ncbi:hypothetical protein HPB49_006035 [Dermacentor silvarum]|uniref:Uncharacterized protein n=1 Tax=Dermacentor silvarum TaxID=543639 RepID=A0ACB8DVT0_DERSI|nr:hypothetical protein HPB49_006035 [Dermacentor silvarum]
MAYGIVYFEEEKSYDVVRMNSITTDSGGELSESSKVYVQWHDLETYAARLVATCELDGFLKRAESLVEALELQKNKSADRCSESLGDELLENDVSHLQPAMVEQQIHSHSLGIVEEHVPDIHVRVEEGVENQSPISLRKPLMPSSASNGET